MLTPIFEPEFLGFSYGFRPGRGAHDALDALAYGIERRKVNWIADADIRAFFDQLDRGWLIEFVEHRIGDRRVIRLTSKWLGAGVMEEGEWRDTLRRIPGSSVKQTVNSAKSSRACWPGGVLSGPRSVSDDHCATGAGSRSPRYIRRCSRASLYRAAAAVPTGQDICRSSGKDTPRKAQSAAHAAHADCNSGPRGPVPGIFGPFCGPGLSCAQLR